MAQSGDKSERVRLGVKGGMHFSNMHYSNLDLYSPDWGSNGVGGIFAEFDLGTSRKLSGRQERLFLSC